ncbi:putative methyltransferase PMT26, partial [Dichanthelium oligosanthes]
ADAKEEDSSIDATNTVKQDSANVVAETITDGTEGAEVAEDPAKPAGDDKGDGEKVSSSKDQSFEDENGKTEGGELVKTGNGGETDGVAAQGKSAEEAAMETDANKDAGGLDQASTDAKERAEQAATTDVKESGGAVAGRGTPKNLTFDDENGKMDGVDLVKDDGNKTRISEESANVEGAALTVKPMAKTTAAAAETTDTDTTTNTASEEEKKQDGGGEQQLPAAEALPNVQAELLTERAAQNGSFTTQAAESTKEKKKRAEKKKGGKKGKKKAAGGVPPSSVWKLCNSSAGADYIPCLDNEAAIKKLKTDIHYEHRERHCPAEAPTCLVPAPPEYRDPIRWPHSRDKIWYHNVPHTMLAEYKGHQNWVKVSGEHLTFPGGGTQFKHGALRYIDLIQGALPEVAWGRRSRVVLDVGCGVASFGGYLFDRDTLTMSLAPKDEHEAQVQFALERGIPAISAVMGTQRLPFPGNVFDVVHCARCRVPWHIDGGKLLLELNRLLRPGGVFVWSATPVYQKLPDDVEIWDAMAKLTKAMCWEMLAKTKRSVVDDQVGLAIFRKPVNNRCYEKRAQKEPALCEPSDDPNAAWNIKLRACMHRVPEDPSVRGARWPEMWPERLGKAPYWLDSSQTGVYGKPAPEDFAADLEHWRKVVRSSYLAGMGIDWKTIRNVMDMRAVYGGLAAALRDMKVWVMNVVTIDSPDTLPVIYERGLFGIYHDWCESFSTYPRSYDLLHADHLFSKLKPRCKVLPVVVEVDRILRPNGKFIVRDDKETVDEIQSVVRSLQWEVRMTVSKNKEAMLCARKTTWRPTEIETR